MICNVQQLTVVVRVNVDGSGMESERQRSPRVQTGLASGTAAVKSWISCAGSADFLVQSSSSLWSRYEYSEPTGALEWEFRRS